MRPGEIYVAQFPFGDVPGMKLRPVLLLTGPVGAIPEVLVAYISSVIPTQLLPSDVLLDPSKPEFRSTHLKTASALRLHSWQRFMPQAWYGTSARSIPPTMNIVASKLKELLKL
jgi:hypothetical protein